MIEDYVCEVTGGALRPGDDADDARAGSVAADLAAADPGSFAPGLLDTLTGLVRPAPPLTSPATQPHPAAQRVNSTTPVLSFFGEGHAYPRCMIRYSIGSRRLWLCVTTTPWLDLDLDIAARRLEELQAALPGTDIHYAVKATRHPATCCTG